MQHYLNSAGDPEKSIGDWVTRGAPLGAEVKIEANDVFPPYEGTKGSKSGFNTGLTFDEILTKSAGNYSSAQDLHKDAGEEIGRMKEGAATAPSPATELAEGGSWRSTGGGSPVYVGSVSTPGPESAAEAAVAVASSAVTSRERDTASTAAADAAVAMASSAA